MHPLCVLHFLTISKCISYILSTFISASLSDGETGENDEGDASTTSLSGRYWQYFPVNNNYNCFLYSASQ